jgi:SAM-dependent methyltransferase
MSGRKALGAWYTPSELVDHVVAVAVAGMTPVAPVTVLDPACGDGRFLEAVAEHFAVRGVDVQLVGADIDAGAVAAARDRVPAAELLHVDALAHDWGGRRFDLVIGNPPFLNQMSSATTRGGRGRYGGGPYADSAAEFLAMAVQLATPVGGRVALVLPQSVVSTRDASPIRAGVLARGALVHAWWAHQPMFDAAVRTCAVVVETGRLQGAVTRTAGRNFVSASPVPASLVSSGSWGVLLLDDAAALPEAGGATLGEIGSFSVDFRDQYYGLVGAVSDDATGPPLVTSGLIEPGRCLWGERAVKFAKQRYEAPRVDLASLSPRMQQWADRRLVPKLLIANQTRTIEAVHDTSGVWLPSVPVITCTSGDPERVAQVLASDGANRWVRHHAAGTGLSANTVRLTPTLLASIPLG